MILCMMGVEGIQEIVLGVKYSLIIIYREGSIWVRNSIRININTLGSFIGITTVSGTVLVQLRNKSLKKLKLQKAFRKWKIFETKMVSRRFK
jgi:hypothetical protein